ncbi:DNA primase [Bacillus phage vB_BpuM-BpSp]|nr:DNA primase [Bacillus phage vB_BpuM-BpSp]
MDNFFLYNYLKAKLSFCALTNRKDETIIRCPFCGDSTKNKNKGHFYIENKSPFKYFCQKCESSGIFSTKLLSILKIGDAGIDLKLREVFIEYQKNIQYVYGTSLKDLNTRELNFKSKNLKNEESLRLKYLENRLGINFEENDIDRFKIILNFEDFVTKNEINLKDYNTSFYRKLLNKLNDECVGFLSTDQTVINFRSLNPDKTGFRYYNFPIYPKILDSKKFYSIKKKINLAESKHKIILTEGVIDLLGVFFHVYDRDTNPIFMASNGRSFLVLLNYLSSISLLNVDIEIYSDNDNNIKRFESVVKNNNLAYFNGLKIFYNTYDNEKDFGVTKNRILPSNAIEL